MITITIPLTPEQSAHLAKNGPFSAQSMGLDVVVTADGVLTASLSADLAAALTASAPGWVEGEMRANS